MIRDANAAYPENLDEGIRPIVQLLTANGVETFESCEGGEGHTFPRPTVRFHGERPEGFRAMALALQHGLPVVSLSRVWTLEDGDPVGPCWELVFTARES